MAENDLKALEGRKLGDTSLKDDIAHWAEVLDRWVKSIDNGLGRSDAGLAEPALDQAEAGPAVEQ